MNNLKYLVLDTESGSRHSTSTLLTAYFMVTDENFNILDELYLTLKPDNDEHYIVDAQGLGVNKIDLVQHDKIALPYKQVKPTLYQFLMKNAGGNKLVPVGHAVKGDIKRIVDNLLSEGSWENFCSYHYIDTSVVLQFLRACGKMPLDCDGSVEALATYFNINQKAGDDANYHNAKFDTIITSKILQKFIKLGKS